MHNNIEGSPGASGPDRMQLVEELQLATRGTPQVVRNVVVTPIAIEVRPADSTARDQFVVTGTTRELQALSVATELSRPVQIGGFYQLCFEDSENLEPTFARCDQITMLAENRFATRFQFLSPIVIPASDDRAADPSGHTRD